MATMKLTVMGLEKELSYSNKSLFDLFNWFTDTENIVDRDALKNRILMRCGEFEVVYSDPDFFRECVNVWSTSYKRTFEKWLNVLYTEYLPLENYNMEERFQDDETRNTEREDTGNKSMSNSASGSNHSQTVIDNDQTSSASSTGEHKISAYDSSTYSPESQDTRSDSATATADETSITDGTTSTSGNASEQTANSGTEDITAQNIHQGGRHGNIGVTTSQQMLEQEMGVALFSFYDRVADLFVSEFCVMVY